LKNQRKPAIKSAKEEYATMSNISWIEEAASEEVCISLDELARKGARQMITAALEVEVDQYLSTLANERDECGHRLVVRNGRGKERSVTVGSGTFALKAPRVNDRRVDEITGEQLRFSSAILPAYARRSPKVADALPVLYLRGLSTGDFRPALRGLLGDDASGLSPSSISRLMERWQGEYEAFCRRRLDFVTYPYLFCDGVHVKIRLGEDERLCLLVVIGVREDGEKELLAVEDGYRESTESWAEVMRDLKGRGLTEPRLITADGALGLWSALSDIYPNTAHQRCWVHKTANVLDALPKRVQPEAKTMIHEIVGSPTRSDAARALEWFRSQFGARYPKALAKLDADWTALTAFYDFPAEHWVHLRTTNPIESTFATVKLRTKVQRGAGSKRAALTMAYKLLDQAQERWRTFNGAHLLEDVVEGVTYRNGIRVADENPADNVDQRVAA
jgi:transposase-like protein